MDFGLDRVSSRQKECIRFKGMGVPEGLLRNIPFEMATPIQRKAIPLIDQGRDVIGISRTGSGKTLAYLIPIVKRALERKENRDLYMKAMAMIIVPTHELALQVQDVVSSLCEGSKVRAGVFTGSTALAHSFNFLVVGVFDIVICTPGRLEHMTKEVAACKDGKPLYIQVSEKGKRQKKDVAIDNSQVLEKIVNPEILVVDEMDRIFEDESLAVSTEHILSVLKTSPQYVLFSATDHKKIAQIQALLGRKAFEKIEISGGVCSFLEQGRLKMNFFLVNEEGKASVLLGLLRVPRISGCRVIVFTSTCKRCVYVAEILNKSGIRSGVLSSEESDEYRESVLHSFRKHEISCLVSTDLGCRGLDIRGVSYVVDFDFAGSRNTEVHRIGRMNREKNEKGEMFSFVRPADLVVYLSFVNLVYNEQPRDSMTSSRVCFSLGPECMAGGEGHQQCIYMGIGRIPPTFYYENGEAIKNLGVDCSIRRAAEDSYDKYNRTLPQTEKIGKSWSIREVNTANVKIHPYFSHMSPEIYGGDKENIWDKLHNYRRRDRGREERKERKGVGLAETEKFRNPNFIRYENKSSSRFAGGEAIENWKEGLGLEGRKRKGLLKEEGFLFGEWKKENRERLGKGMFSRATKEERVEDKEGMVENELRGVKEVLERRKNRSRAVESAKRKAEMKKRDKGRGGGRRGSDRGKGERRGKEDRQA
jgi:ATP-dependent RNA helicase RhlE